MNCGPSLGGRGDADEPFELPDEPLDLPPEEEPYELPDGPVEYRLVVLNDDVHCVDYVAWLLSDVLGIPWADGYRLAFKIHENGQAVVFTGSWEEVQRVRDRIITYGPDPLMGTKEAVHVEIEGAA